jgi:hypothetical protein
MQFTKPASTKNKMKGINKMKTRTNLKSSSGPPCHWRISTANARMIRHNWRRADFYSFPLRGAEIGWKM